MAARKAAGRTAGKARGNRKASTNSAPAGRPVSASRTEMVEVVLPQDANPLGSVLGGRVMHLVAMAAAITASRHCRRAVVTASVDHMDFRNPIRVGELIILKASVNRVFRTSMEIGVKVFSEDVLSGERKHTTSAYTTFVALDENRHPTVAPALLCETAEDRRRYREAMMRRNVRLAQRYKSK
jgi:acyl-CoA hydrolase